MGVHIYIYNLGIVPSTLKTTINYYSWGVPWDSQSTKTLRSLLLRPPASSSAARGAKPRNVGLKRDADRATRSLEKRPQILIHMSKLLGLMNVHQGHDLDQYLVSYTSP